VTSDNVSAEHHAAEYLSPVLPIQNLILARQLTQVSLQLELHCSWVSGVPIQQSNFIRVQSRTCKSLNPSKCPKLQCAVKKLHTTVVPFSSSSSYSTILIWGSQAPIKERKHQNASMASLLVGVEPSSCASLLNCIQNLNSPQEWWCHWRVVLVEQRASCDLDTLLLHDSTSTSSLFLMKNRCFFGAPLDFLYTSHNNARSGAYFKFRLQLLCHVSNSPTPS
jgi:hypothetical protein